MLDLASSDQLDLGLPGNLEGGNFHGGGGPVGGTGDFDVTACSYSSAAVLSTSHSTAPLATSTTDVLDLALGGSGPAAFLGGNAGCLGIMRAGNRPAGFLGNAGCLGIESTGSRPAWCWGDADGMGITTGGAPTGCLGRTDGLGIGDADGTGITADGGCTGCLHRLAGVKTTGGGPAGFWSILPTDP